ncbi:MAG: hypothetical protein C5B50_29265 [Verrucomicrobia bacterium]|nr:MAG: hypothetical protein C5B50_29265 [Verrucomicrobiota bacterium]
MVQWLESQGSSVEARQNTHYAIRTTHNVSRFTFHVSRFNAFSLIEILVTITLLSFIVIGLLIMFNQTQRVFKQGMMQTDVLENGRAVMDMLVRDLEQMTPANGPTLTAGQYNWPWTINFFAAAERQDPQTMSHQSLSPTPLTQSLPGCAFLRTNIIEQYFFLSRLNQDWIGTGYQIVRDDDKDALTGSLYRYSSTNATRGAPFALFYNMYDIGNRTFSPPGGFPNPARTPVGAYSGMSSNRIADGVVHLRLRAMDTNGLPLLPYGLYTIKDLKLIQLACLTNAIQTNGHPLQPYLHTILTNAYGAINYDSGAQLDQVDYYCWSNAVPAYLELELGILEPKTLQRYKSIGAATPAGRKYLFDNVAKVHLFRQRIPIRNVDFSAYQ